MGENDWVTPKLAIKKRRASTVLVSHQKRNDRPRPTNPDLDRKSQNEKFNPFLRSKPNTSVASRPDSIGMAGNSDSSNDSTKENNDSQSKSEFLSALDNVGNVIAAAAPIHPSNETFLHDRIRQMKRVRRRATISSVDDLNPPRMDDDDTARDGFTPQNDIMKLKHPPVDFSIKTQMKLSMGDCNCFRRVKQIDWAKAVSRALPDLDKSIQKLTQECVYYAWPPVVGSLAYPRFGRNFPGHFEDIGAHWMEFNDVLSSIFTSLRSGVHNYFYVAHCQYTIFVYRINDLDSEDFASSEQSMNQTNVTTMPGVHIRAVIAPVSRGLKERLIREEIIEDDGVKNSDDVADDSASPKHKSYKSQPSPPDVRRTYDRTYDEHQDEEHHEPPGFDIDDEQSWDALRGAQAIKMKTKSAHGTKFHDGTDYHNTAVVVDGKNRVSYLINFLMKEQEESTSAREFPPTVLTHLPFLSSTVKTLQIRTAQDHLLIDGVILPSHQLMIHKIVKEIIVKRGQGEYTTHFITEKHTRSLNTGVPGSVRFNDLEDPVDVDMWLATKPQTVRELRWKSGFYLI